MVEPRGVLTPYPEMVEIIGIKQCNGLYFMFYSSAQLIDVKSFFINFEKLWLLSWPLWVVALLLRCNGGCWSSRKAFLLSFPSLLVWKVYSTQILLSVKLLIAFAIRLSVFKVNVKVKVSFVQKGSFFTLFSFRRGKQTIRTRHSRLKICGNKCHIIKCT